MEPFPIQKTNQNQLKCYSGRRSWDGPEVYLTPDSDYRLIEGAHSFITAIVDPSPCGIFHVKHLLWIMGGISCDPDSGGCPWRLISSNVLGHLWSGSPTHPSRGTRLGHLWSDHPSHPSLDISGQGFFHLWSGWPLLSPHCPSFISCQGGSSVLFHSFHKNPPFRKNQIFPVLLVGAIIWTS